MQCVVLRKPSVACSKSSAKNMSMQSNGHLNPGSFSEYTGHIILAPQGEDNAALVRIMNQHNALFFTLFCYHASKTALAV
jgi:hypothetical protein